MLALSGLGFDINILEVLLTFLNFGGGFFPPWNFSADKRQIDGWSEVPEIARNI